MTDYQHILCVVDLSDENFIVASRAAELATRYQAELRLLHVVEYIPIDLANELVLPQQQEIEEQLVIQAKKNLAALAAKIAVDQLQTVVVQGSTKSEILAYAEVHHSDLIVLGRHSRHGLSRLLGSVANAVLHDATCDVMTVKVGK